MKRALSLLLVLILTLSLVGCSANELGMYSTIKEVSGLGALQTEGVVSISGEGTLIDTLLSNIPTEYTKLKESIKSGLEVKYTSKQNSKTFNYEIDLWARFKNEKDFTKLTTIVGDNKVIYVKADDFIYFVKPYVIEKDPKTGTILDLLASKFSYIEFSMDDLNKSEYTKNSFANLANRDKVLKVYTGLLDVFFNAYKDYSTGAITKNGDTYTFSLDAKGMKEMMVSLVEYTIKNADNIVDSLKASIAAMSDEDLSIILNPTGTKSLTKEDLENGLESFRTSVKSIDIKEFDTFKNSRSFNETFEAIEGTNLKYSITKVSDSKYKMSTELVIKYLDMLKLDITEKFEVTKIDTFTYKKPDSYITKTEVEKMFKPFTSANEVQINLDKKSTKFKYITGRESNTDLGIYVKDGSTYLPLRQLAETFGEDVSWDGEAKVAKVNGIIMTGLEVNDRIYVKVRDFEKLGYNINWDEGTSTATIKKK